MPETLDANQAGAVTANFPVTGSSRLAVYCKKESGRCKNQVLELELTPDGNEWFSSGQGLSSGFQYFDVIAKFARISVKIPDGEASIVTLFFET